MGCSCNKGSAGRQTYEVTFPDGSKRPYPSEVEAQSAIARKGGGTYKIKS
jgi:hypothetical protein